MKARAYHGMGSKSWQVSGWSRDDWQREAGGLDVVVMTPEVCLHACCHAGLRVRGGGGGGRRGGGGVMTPEVCHAGLRGGGLRGVCVSCGFRN